MSRTTQNKKTEVMSEGVRKGTESYYRSVLFGYHTSETRTSKQRAEADRGLKSESNLDEMNPFYKL